MATGAMADFELPQASITRIVKTALPENMQVSREAKLAFSKSAGVFILYLTSACVALARLARRGRASSSSRTALSRGGLAQRQRRVPPLQAADHQCAGRDERAGGG